MNLRDLVINKTAKSAYRTDGALWYQVGVFVFPFHFQKRLAYASCQSIKQSTSCTGTVVVCALTSNLHRAKEPGSVLLGEGEANLLKSKSSHAVRKRI